MSKPSPHLYDQRRINGALYLAEHAARDYIGRGATTLWTWRQQGMVKAIRFEYPDGHRHWLYHAGSLRIAKREALRRKRTQPVVGGAGRGNTGPLSPDLLTKRRQRSIQRVKRADDEQRQRRAAQREAAEAAERLEDEAYARAE